MRTGIYLCLPEKTSVQQSAEEPKKKPEHRSLPEIKTTSSVTGKDTGRFLCVSNDTKYRSAGKIKYQPEHKSLPKIKTTSSVAGKDTDRFFDNHEGTSTPQRQRAHDS